MIPLKDNLPTRGVPKVTLALIALSLLAFGWQLTLSSDSASSPELARAGVSERQQAALAHGAVPSRVLDPGSECVVLSGEVRCGEDGAAGSVALEQAPWWSTLLSATFLAAGLLQLLVNVLFLWLFGKSVEAALGGVRFGGFYLLSGVVAIYVQAVLDPTATGAVLGSSGAVAGVLGAHLALHPRAKILALVLVPLIAGLFEIASVLLVAAWFLLQLIPAVGEPFPDLGSGGGGPAYVAHLTGFAFGLATARLLRGRARSEGQHR